MHLEVISKDRATRFVREIHYSKVMPKLTKHFLGCFINDPDSVFENDKLVGVITLGWGTRPLHTIQKLFAGYTSNDYYEIGKMCMSEESKIFKKGSGSGMNLSKIRSKYEYINGQTGQAIRR